MASSLAIAAVGDALAALLLAALRDAGHATAPAAQVGAADLARGYSTSTLTVYLYRLGIDASTRNRPPRRTSDGRVLRPSLPLELHVLVTAGGSDVAEQQRLLGLALTALGANAELPAAALNAVTASGDVFDPTESVTLVPAPVPQAEMVAIWEVAKANMQPSMPYIARVVYLESAREVDRGAPVTTRVLDVEPS